jgi:hypothetical protein
MAGFSTKISAGAPHVPRGKKPSGGPRFQESVRAPTNFPRVKVSRRDYSKGEQAAENPLGFSEGSKSNFGDTGLTGET